LPNLGGIFEPGLPDQEIRKKNDRQIRRMRISGIHYDEYRYSDEGFSAALLDHGILENGTQPVRSGDGRFVMFLDGELYNGDELRKQFRADLAAGPCTDTELCLSLLTRHGLDVLPSINGLFILVLYDRTERRLQLISDRYGFRPLFYLRRKNLLIFGSELKTITAVDSGPRQLDELGLQELFCYGHQVMDRTWLSGYLKLRPATILECSPSGISERQYWTYAYDEQAPKLDQTTYVIAYRNLMGRAVERGMKGNKRIGIFLSGGYDSRVVAASIRKYHFPIPSVTFGVPESRDVRFAEQLADRLGFDHTTLNDEQPFLVDNCRAIVWRTEGMLPFANTTSIRYHDELHQRMDIILTGFLGELGGSHTWPGIIFARSRTAAINTIFEWLVLRRRDTVKRVFNPGFFDRMFAGLHVAFTDSFDTLKNDHPLNIADCWNRIYANPRNTLQSPSIDRHRFEARAPHMDPELVEFLLGIPPWSRIEQRVYKKMIACGYPEIRDIPCTNSARPIDPLFVREYSLMTARAMGRKISGALQGMFGGRQSLGRESSDLGSQFRAEPGLVSEFLRPMMAEGVFPAEIFNHAGIDGLVRDHYERKTDHSLLIALLISWGFASRWLLHDQLDDAPGYKTGA